MGGSFMFELRRAHFDAAKYSQALHAIKALKQQPPKEIYVSYGPEDLNIALVLKVHARADWTLMLPVDPLRDEMEVGFTYGVTSRGAAWSYIRTLLCVLCKAVPGAFHLEYHDDDVGEHGRWDARLCEFVVLHGDLAATWLAAAHLQTGAVHGRHH